MNRVVRMMKTGDFNPHFFDWPSLTMYVHLVAACLVFLAGAMRGAWHSLAQVGPSDFYVYGRMVTVPDRHGDRRRPLRRSAAMGRRHGAPGGCAARGRAKPHTRVALRADRCADRVLLHAGAVDVAPRARATGDARFCAGRPDRGAGRVLQVQRFDGRGAASDRGGRRRRLVRADLAVAADCGRMHRGWLPGGDAVRGTRPAEVPERLCPPGQRLRPASRRRGGMVAVSEVSGPVARVGGPHRGAIWPRPLHQSHRDGTGAGALSSCSPASHSSTTT